MLGKCDCLSLGHSSEPAQTEALLLGSLAQLGLCRHLLRCIACLDIKAGGRVSPHACSTCKQVVTIEKNWILPFCECESSFPAESGGSQCGRHVRITRGTLQTLMFKLHLDQVNQPLLSSTVGSSFFLIGGKLLYNVVLVSSVQGEWVIIMYIHIPSQHPTLLSHRRAAGWAPCVIYQLSTATVKWSVSCYISKQGCHSHCNLGPPNINFWVQQAPKRENNACDPAAVWLPPLPTESEDLRMGKIKKQDAGPRQLRCIWKEWCQWNHWITKITACIFPYIEEC